MKVNRERISLAKGEIGRYLGNGEFGRDQPVKVDEIVLALTLGQLHQKKYDVDADEGVVDHRDGLGWGGVANGYHRSIDLQDNVFGLRYRSSRYIHPASSLWPCQNHSLEIEFIA